MTGKVIFLFIFLSSPGRQTPMATLNTGDYDLKHANILDHTWTGSSEIVSEDPLPVSLPFASHTKDLKVGTPVNDEIDYYISFYRTNPYYADDDIYKLDFTKYSAQDKEYQAVLSTHLNLLRKSCINFNYFLPQQNPGKEWTNGFCHPQHMEIFLNGELPPGIHMSVLLHEIAHIFDWELPGISYVRNVYENLSGEPLPYLPSFILCECVAEYASYLYNKEIGLNYSRLSGSYMGSYLSLNKFVNWRIAKSRAIIVYEKISEFFKTAEKNSSKRFAGKRFAGISTLDHTR